MKDVPQVRLIGSWVLSCCLQTRLSLEEVDAIAKGARPEYLEREFWTILRTDCQRFLPELKGEQHVTTIDRVTT